MALPTPEGDVTAANPAYFRLFGYAPEEVLGHDFLIIFPNDQREQARASYFANFQHPATGPPFETTITLADDTRCIAAISYSFLITNGVRSAMLSVIRDITESKQAEVRLEERVQQYMHELSILLQVSQSVASTLELEPLLRTILEQVKSVVDYNDIALLQLEEEHLSVLAFRGEHSLTQMERLLQNLEHSLLYPQFLQGRTPIIIDDVQASHPSFAQFYRELKDESAQKLLAQIRSWMSIPLMAGDRVVGFLTLNHQLPHFYTQHHADLVFALANQIASALENARLYEQAQTLAAIQERQRLASELHDTVSQELYSISLGAQNALEILDSEASHEARASIEHVIRRAAAAIIEMRTLIFELSSETLGSDGLIVALTRHVEMLQTAYQLSIETSLREEPDIPLVSKHVLYRVAQEALHNVIKHAYASKVDLRLTLEKFTLVLEVHDNGRGFDPAGHFPNHFGLLSMRERVKSIHGTISIASTPGQGTLVCVRLPLRK